MRAFDDLFEEEDTLIYGLRPDFSENRYNQYAIDWREYFGLPYLRHSLRLRLNAAFIDQAVDDFFWLYFGGLDGIRGYTYYSIGGRKYAVGAGLRLLLPIGPLRFDFAHNPEREVDERSWTFHFSIGYPF